MALLKKRVQSTFGLNKSAISAMPIADFNCRFSIYGKIGIADCRFECRKIKMKIISENTKNERNFGQGQNVLDK